MIRDVDEIFTLMGVPVQTTEVLRVGKKKPERPRVVRVTLTNATEKRNLLVKATSLRNIPENHKFARVYVKPNLTQQQQNSQTSRHRYDNRQPRTGQI